MASSDIIAPEACTAPSAETAHVQSKVVQERRGHATISITLDIYSHEIPAMQQTAAALVATMLAAAGHVTDG